MKKILLLRQGEVEDYLLFLQEVEEEYTYQQFENDSRIFTRSIRFLQVTIEYIFELGAYIVLEEEDIKFRSFNRVVEKLSGRDLMSARELDTLQSAVDFRNLLVDIYMDIDPGLVFDFLENVFELKRILKIFIEHIIRNDIFTYR
ncbi:MAG: HepT-like ribonuclease domain-containing protein [Halanaerobiales bacterium]